MLDAAFSLLQSPTAVAVSAGLLVTLPVGFAVTLGLWVLLRLLTPSRANVRYVFCLSGLLLIVVSGLLTTAWLVEFPEAPHQLQSQLFAETYPAPNPTVSARGSAEPSEVFEARSLHPAATSSDAGGRSLLALFLLFSPWLTATWMVGVLFFTARMLVVLSVDHGVVQAATPLSDPNLLQQIQALAERVIFTQLPRVLCSHAVSSPAVHGWWRPTLLLPVSFATQFPPDQIEAMLLHELAHLRRHDYLVNLIQMLVDALLFFNPMVWWLNRQIRLERESCCDLAAAQACSAKVLAHALADLAGAVTPPPLATAQPLGGFPRGSLLHRIQRLLSPQTRPKLHLSLQQCASFLGSWGVGLVFLFFVSRQAALLAQPFWIPAAYETLTAQHEQEQTLDSDWGDTVPAQVRVTDPGGRTYVIVPLKQAPAKGNALKGRLFSSIGGRYLAGRSFQVALIPLAETTNLAPERLAYSAPFLKHDTLVLAVPGFALATWELDKALHHGQIAEFKVRYPDPLRFQPAAGDGTALRGSPVTVEVLNRPVIEPRTDLFGEMDRRNNALRKTFHHVDASGWVTVDNAVCAADLFRYWILIRVPGFGPRLVKGTELDGKTVVVNRLRGLDVVLQDASGQPIQDGWARARGVLVPTSDQKLIWLEPSIEWSKTDRSGRGQVWFPDGARQILVEAGVGRPPEPRIRKPAVPDHHPATVPDYRMATATVSAQQEGPVVLTLKRYGADIVIEKGDADLETLADSRNGRIGVLLAKMEGPAPRYFAEWGGIELTEEEDRYHARLDAGLPGCLLQFVHPLGKRFLEPDENGIYRVRLRGQGEPEVETRVEGMVEPQSETRVEGMVEPKVPLREVTLALEVGDGGAPPEGTLTVHWQMPGRDPARVWNGHKARGLWPLDRVPLAFFGTSSESGPSVAKLEVAVRDGRAEFHAPAGAQVRVIERGLIGYRTSDPGLDWFTVPEGTGPVTLTFGAERRGVVALKTSLPIWMREELRLPNDELYHQVQFVGAGSKERTWIHENHKMSSGRNRDFPLSADDVSVQKGILRVSAHIPLDIEMQLFVQLNGIVFLSEPFTATVAHPMPEIRFDWEQAWTQIEIETTYKGKPISFWPSGQLVGWPPHTFRFDPETIGTKRFSFPKAWEHEVRIGSAMWRGWNLSHHLQFASKAKRDNRYWLYFGKQEALEPDLTHQTFELDAHPLPREGEITTIFWKDRAKRLWRMVLSQERQDGVLLLTPLFLAVHTWANETMAPRPDRTVPFRLYLKKSDQIQTGFTEPGIFPTRYAKSSERKAFESSQTGDETLLILHLDQLEELVPNMLWHLEGTPLRLSRERLHGAVVALDPGASRRGSSPFMPDTAFQFSDAFWDQNQNLIKPSGYQ